MPIRAFLHHHWPTVTIAVTAAAIGCAALVMLGNMPPHRIVMATGPEGSPYAEYGKRYRAALAKAGVEVQLRSTAGSVETAALLRDPRSGVSVGLMQGGIVGAANTAGLESLGTVPMSRCGGSAGAKTRAWGPTACAAARSRSDRQAAARARCRWN